MTVAQPEAPTQKEFKAQEGPQELFLSSPADIVVYGGAAFGGKRLDVETLIATPDGFRAMGNLCRGDVIFGSQGQRCRVVVAHDVVEVDDAYRVVFDDGEEIIADADHLWHTFTSAENAAKGRRNPEFRAKRRAARPSRATGSRGSVITELVTERNKTSPTPLRGPVIGSLRTTESICVSLLDGRGRPNHWIPLCGALDLPPLSLPIDPYLLGLWLGDGTTTSGGMTTADIEIVEAFRAQGYEVRKWKDRYGWGVCRLVSALRALGVLGHKHIPAVYFRGSTAQRLALIQGLMDTDGCSCESGGAEFTTTTWALAEGMLDLIRSMGGKARICEGRATLYGRDCGPKYRIKWSPHFPAFRLHRKLARQRVAFRASTRMRAIIRCERFAGPVRMRCITVDSRDGLFLAGRGLVPTHNTFGLLMEAGRYTDIPGFSCTIFRRSIPQIMNQGALWDESFEIYPYLGGTPSVGAHSWTWPSGSEIKMAHLQEEKTIYDYDGAQIPLIEFDQLEQFTERQFFYLLSRNRSGCGVIPYIRASANPPKQKGHWLRALVDWWIGKDGYPIPERCGVIRYFIRVDNQIQWVEESYRTPEGDPPKSFTFIAAKYTDNRIGLSRDPNYVTNLNAQDRVDKQRLKEGNWNAVEGGTMFDRDWFVIKEAHEIPPGIRKMRYWDRAATLPTAKKPDPDWTAGALCGQKDGVLYVFDMQHFQENPAGNERELGKTARIDGRQVPIYIEEEGGSAGKDTISHYQRTVLRGYIVVGDRPTGDKTERAKPWCALSFK